jgi:hypothetical protein
MLTAVACTLLAGIALVVLVLGAVTVANAWHAGQPATRDLDRAPGIRAGRPGRADRAVSERSSAPDTPPPRRVRTG